MPEMQETISEVIERITKGHRPYRGPASLEKIHDAACEAFSSGEHSAEDWVNIIVATMVTDYETKLQDQAEESVYVFKELMDMCSVSPKDILEIGNAIATLRQKYRSE